MSSRIPEVPHAEAAYTLGEASDAYLTANHLSRAEWEAMVERELAKMVRPIAQPDLFA